MSIKVYGSPDKLCKQSEIAHMVTFFNFLRTDYPEIAKIAVHVRNEGLRSHGQAVKYKTEGMVKGACDIIIPGNPALCIEMKSKRPGAKVSKEQMEYLEAAQAAGAFACIAIGVDGAIDALKEWL